MKRQHKNAKATSDTTPSPSLQPEDSNHTTTNGDEPLFFYMPDATYGEFCQWYPSTFTINKSLITSLVGHHLLGTNTENDQENSIAFTCAEQFMMYCKAAYFDDEDTQRLVLATSSPKEQKRLGKLTNGFDVVRWDEVKSSVVETGSIAKFAQNVKLKRKLLATEERTLVEAASRDRVWGIGYAEKHAMAHRRHWGENRLGKALMVARDVLKREE